MHDSSVFLKKEKSQTTSSIVVLFPLRKMRFLFLFAQRTTTRQWKG